MTERKGEGETKRETEREAARSWTQKSLRLSPDNVIRSSVYTVNERPPSLFLLSLIRRPRKTYTTFAILTEIGQRCCLHRRANHSNASWRIQRTFRPRCSSRDIARCSSRSCRTLSKSVMYDVMNNGLFVSTRVKIARADRLRFVRGNEGGETCAQALADGLSKRAICTVIRLTCSREASHGLFNIRRASVSAVITTRRHGYTRERPV